jgi:biotin transport system substrate-specific component
MLETYLQTRDQSRLYRFAAIFAFTALTAIGAQIEIRIGEFVPITLQVFFALLAGMVLGGRDGAYSQVLYVGLIALNLPLASGFTGAAALTGATAGYIFGFAPAALVVGQLTNRANAQGWQRWLAGMVGVGIIYTFGLLMLKSVTGLGWEQAWAAGVMPFIGLDIVKAALAATLAETGRAFLHR